MNDNPYYPVVLALARLALEPHALTADDVELLASVRSDLGQRAAMALELSRAAKHVTPRKTTSRRRMTK